MTRIAEATACYCIFLGIFVFLSKVVISAFFYIPASKDFAQTAYILATNSLHLTNMCVMYRPQTIACVCIHLASKWAPYQVWAALQL
jgi:hypothetical protein